MFSLIEDWLFSQLNINLNINKLDEDNIFHDGCILVNILQKYGIVDDNFSKNIHPTNQKQECVKNLKLLNPLFDMLKIKYNDIIINDIAENKAGTVVNLLYELYICLENKQHLYFITQQNFKKVTQNVVKGLDSITVNKNVQELDNFVSNMCLEQPLINHRDVIKWYENKYKKVKDNLDAKVKKLKGNLPNKEILNVKLMGKTCLTKCTRPSNSNIFVDLPDINSFLKRNEDENILDYKELIAKYKLKQHNKAVKKSFENNIQHELLQNTWSKIEEKQNEIYKSVFSTILLKQSQYEKQLLSKLTQTQKEVQIQNEHKIWAKQNVIADQEDKIYSDFELKHRFEMLEKINENEEKRVLELHKKLYKEKKEIIKKGNYNMCKDIVDSLLDISICAAEYKSKYGVEVYKGLWDNWMQRFFKSQPIHIQLQSLEDDISAGKDVDYDDAISFEKEQDEILNENDIDDYLFTCGQWFYRNICLENMNVIDNNLAFIVYRLLTIKYPLPLSPPAADLPLFKVAGILLNLHSTDTIEKLKLLLSKPGIHIFDTEMAVKKCITQFHIETSPSPEENTKGKKKELNSGKAKSKKSSKQLSMKEKKAPKGKGNKKSQKKKSEELEENLNYSEVGKINVVEKETQTSVIGEIEEQKTNRTSLGLLGEEVFSKLNKGEKLNDSLIASVIIEYLKSLEEYDGWLLLNYPTTLNQASHLELALTGNKIPMENYILDENETLQSESCDEWIEHRKSRLLNPPLSETDAQYFKSYFTVFVNIEDEVKDDKSIANQNRISGEDDLETNSLKSQNIREKVNTDPNLLKEFYSNQAILKELYNETFDLNSLKKLARLILKEDDIEFKQSTDLFGEEILNKLAKSKKADNKGKKSLKNKNPKGQVNKIHKKNEKNPIEIVPTDQENSLEVDIAEQEFKPEGTETIENNNQLPIEESKHTVHNWKFVSLPLNNEFGALLATIWENIESCYISNLKDILFENRIINLRLHPYCIYVQKEIKKVTDKSDLKQNLINMFLKDYNNISNELRTLPDMKNQLHCRVLELQENLWEIVDTRKREAETKRQDIIYENWLVSELCMLINNFLSLVQTEFERSLETLKLVNDYYMNSLEKTSSVLTIQPENQNFSRISEEALLKTARKMSGESESTDKYNDNELDKNNFIAHGLVHCYEEQKTLYLLEALFSDKIEDVKLNFTSITHTFYAQNKSVADPLASSTKQLKKGKPIVNKQPPSIKPTKGKEKQKGSTKSRHSEEQGEDKSSIIEALIEEWRFTIQTETERFNFRLNLIKERAKENITEFFCFMESVFCSLYQSVLSHYNTEISNINSICNYLKTAIEEESPLHHPLILEKDSFFIGINETEEKAGESILRELKEDVYECSFTIEQLSKLINIFKISGPLGIIRKQPLCYILQDLMLLGSGDSQSYLPNIWESLSELQLRYVIDDIFGLEFGVDWRDFIIYNLDVPYPEVSDILNMRKQFISYDLEENELISVEDYENVTLWFENELPDSPKQGLRFSLVKNLLPEMFKVDETHINYTALLLYFCKDFTAENGLKKALSLSLGKNVVTSKSELEIILQKEEEINEIVTSVLIDITDGIIMNRETAQVYEILESYSVMDYSENGSSKSSLESSLFSSLKSVSSKLLKSHSIPMTPPNSPLNNISVTTQISSPNPGFNRESWVTRIPITSVLSVLNASFFFKDRKISLKNQLNCVEDEADSDGMIEAYDLVQLSYIQRLFSMTNKYKISKPCDIIKKCLNDEYDNSNTPKHKKRTTLFLSW